MQAFPKLVTSISAVSAVTGLAAYAVRAPSSNWLAPSIFHGPRTRKAIALTFDDGPSAATPAIAALLERYGARGTFFQCGHHVRRMREITRLLVEAGHEIGNHTDTHAPLWLQRSSFIQRQVGDAQASIAAACGVKPRWFRAPYGVRWFGLRDAQKQYQLTGVMWTCLALDWKLSAAAVAERLLRHARNGSIFCLHDGRELQESPDVRNTISALEILLPTLISGGYELTTVSNLLRVE